MIARKALPAALIATVVAGLALAQRTPSPAPAPAPAPAPTRPAAPTAPMPAARPAPITGGYVLSHEHPTYGMAFGGNYAFAGAPGNYKNGVMEKGYTAECGGCKMLSGCDHGEFKGNIVAALGQVGSDMGDHPSHKGPVHDSFSHLRYSTEWIKDAYAPKEDEYKDTRLKLMVAFAVENEAMCEQVYYANKGKGGPGGDGYPCSKGDSLESMERQIDAIKAWAKENASWMEIAYTAADARRIVNANKLAIVIGIESEYSFGAENRKFDPVERLKRYHDKGVRTFYLAHKINSRLSGADIYLSKDTGPGKAVRATQAIFGCFYYDDNVGPFPLKNNRGHNFCDNTCGPDHFKGDKITDKCVSRYGEISEANMADYVMVRGAGAFNGFSIYPHPPGFKKHAKWPEDVAYDHNHLGLSHDGERVVREAMLKGMIVNIDHVSSHARRDIYELSTQAFGGYPLNALHNSPNAMLVGNSSGRLATPHPHEYDFDDNELDFIAKTGGFFGVRVGPFDAREDVESGLDTGVKVNCSKTITETAKMLAYLLEKKLPVGYALDFATITQGVHSRTLRNCGRDLGPDHLHQYGNEIAEGLTHVGMMKKWHKELETVGLKSKYLDKLKNDGVEAFIAMWERSEAKSTVGTQIPREIFENETGGGKKCAEDSDCGTNEFCTAGIPDFKENVCKPKKGQGELCTTKRQCASDRCAVGRCAAADQCQANKDCAQGEYCGDPIMGKRSCKALHARGELCTDAVQCATGRCSAGRCADPDECSVDTDCASNQYCGDPVLGKRTCKALLAHGALCTSARQCATERCVAGRCADADECRSNGDCKTGQYCGDPVLGKRTCKDLRPKGAGCTKGEQCRSGKCPFLKCD